MAEMISNPGPDGTPAEFHHWPDSGGIAVITWQNASGQVQRREVADEREASQLLATISADDQLNLVSAQLRRVGIGPDS
jgi:hypothetical protein